MWQDMRTSENGYIHNGAITLEVFVASQVSHGIECYSRRQTGYVGLKSHGDGCYMNSLLQIMYFNNELRRAVYKFPTEEADCTKLLQQIFHDLQFSDKSVDSKSFRRLLCEQNRRHNVRDVLDDIRVQLQSNMVGTVLDGVISGLFEGIMWSYTKCKNVDYCSIRSETFYDLQLNIKDKIDIYDSFNYYISPKTLEGHNKYDAGVHGLQEATKIVKFTSFPKVLHLHLMCFPFDSIAQSPNNCTDPFVFYEQINLDGFLKKAGSIKAEYVLHAVLVHSGEMVAGHYCVYISPKCDGKWYKFDDEVVTSCKKEDAIEMNYGGMHSEVSLQTKRDNARMLVYIKKSEIEHVLREIPECEIPRKLIERLKLDERSLNERNEANLFVSVHVLLEEHFKECQNRSILDLEKDHHRQFTMKQTQTIDEMMDEFVESFSVTKDRMRVWILHSTQTQKFLYLDMQREGGRSIEQIAKSQNHWVIFLQMCPPDNPSRVLPIFDPEDEILIFAKYYDDYNKLYNYIGCSQQPLARRLSELLSDVNRHLGFDPETELTVVYDDQKISNLDESLEKVLGLYPENDNHITPQGYLLIFEKKCTDSSLKLQTTHNNFNDLEAITFCDIIDPNESGIVVELSNRFTYEEMIKSVADRLNIDPNNLQFFACNEIHNNVPVNALSPSDFLKSAKQGNTKKLFYKRMPLNSHELDDKKQNTYDVVKSLSNEVPNNCQKAVVHKSSTTAQTLALPSLLCTVLVPTALVSALTENGCIPLRAVINSSLTTSRVASSFVLSHNIKMLDLDGETFVKMTITPNKPSSIKYNMLLLVTNDLPRKPYSMSINESIEEEFENLVLADPDFTTNAKVELEFGADLYSKILKSNVFRVHHESLMAQDSKLGWLIMGSYIR